MLISRRVTFSIPGQAAGDLTYFNGTDWVSLPAGGAGQFLSTNGTVPFWDTVISGDGRVRISGTADKPVAWTISGFFTGVTSAKAAEITMALENVAIGGEPTRQLVKAYILLTAGGVAQEEVYDRTGVALLSSLSFSKNGNDLLVNMVFNESVQYRVSFIEA